MASLPDAWLVVPVTAPGAPAWSRAEVEASTAARPLSQDEALLSALYAEHAPRILRFLRDLLGDPAAAADATQETFVRAFRRIDSLRAEGKVAPWLFGIARNVALEHRRARRRSGRVMCPEAEGDARVEEPDGRTPEAELLGREAVRVVGDALGRLSDDRRTVLLLRLDHGLGYDDIANLMGWSEAKVKVEIHRARLVLRAALVSYEGGSR